MAACQVLELGGGYGRNQPLLREVFTQAKFLMIEQSPANMQIAVSKMKVPEADCLCASVQKVDWATYASTFDVIVDWWTLSYLEVADVRMVLAGISKALKPGGAFIISLPVTLRSGNRGGPMDIRMNNRMQCEYEALFTAAGLEHHPCLPEPQQYEPVAKNNEYLSSRESVWILTHRA